MRNHSKHVFVLLPVVLAALAFAPGRAIGQEVPNIEIFDADLGGSGCPEGTASVVLSADKRTLTILFDDYIAEDDERVSCNIAVALSVPDGITVALLDIDYRGFASIPDRPGRSGHLRAEYFFAGDRGPVFTHNFPRGYEDDYLLSHDVAGVVWAPCGADVIARANTSARTRGAGAFLSVDTVDIETSGITYYLDWAEC